MTEGKTINLPWTLGPRIDNQTIIAGPRSPSEPDGRLVGAIVARVPNEEDAKNIVWCMNHFLPLVDAAVDALGALTLGRHVDQEAARVQLQNVLEQLTGVRS